MEPVVTTTGSSSENILFLAYEVTRDSVSGKISTRILYQKKVAGLVKPNSMENTAAEPGNWRIMLTDKKDKPVESVLIENPLHKRLEYIGADGKLAMKEIWLKRAEVAIRLNYKKNMTKAVVQEIRQDKKNYTIFKHSLLPTEK
jgi:hypothetical protein